MYMELRGGREREGEREGRERAKKPCFFRLFLCVLFPSTPACFLAVYIFIAAQLEPPPPLVFYGPQRGEERRGEGRWVEKREEGRS